MMKYVALCCLFANLVAMDNSTMRLRHAMQSSASAIGGYGKVVLPLVMTAGAETVQQVSKAYEDDTENTCACFAAKVIAMGCAAVWWSNELANDSDSE